MTRYGWFSYCRKSSIGVLWIWLIFCSVRTSEWLGFRFDFREFELVEKLYGIFSLHLMWNEMQLSYCLLLYSQSNACALARFDWYSPANLEYYSCNGSVKLFSLYEFEDCCFLTRHRFRGEYLSSLEMRRKVGPLIVYSTNRRRKRMLKVLLWKLLFPLLIA